MTHSDESAQQAFELRRQLGVIHSQATLLEDEALGSITADQRDALEEIIAATLALTGETATAVEPAAGGYVTDHDEQALEEPPSELISSVEPTEVVLAVGRDNKFVDSLASQFERAGYGVQVAATGEELMALLERPEPQHLVLDCRFPSGPFLESIEHAIDAADGETAVTLVSTVVPATDDGAGSPAGTAPLQGLAGILSPTVSVATLEALFESRFGLAPDQGDTDTAVAVVGDIDARFLETLESMTDRKQAIEQEAYVSSDTLSMVDPATVDCVFLTGDSVDRADDATLAAFRRPIDDEAIPLVAVGELPVERPTQPDGTESEWLPIRGYRTPRATPLTATELTATVLAAIEADSDNE
ncbi:hypothetical protein G6M89_03355 [Natronolimnobius sp. AArcel1]|uniref:hypothetical protein n=1 Tax=Natronolimnobius sp. AArcel1 TaxID=1679093 RepID=UPI0013EA4C85|nr:hypothetical protein [Natronolimnobius sp. AArcel1]NGM68058.1 hypothetical protein [Natronolimnobius sp. AArcel1]